ncbi:hypothetical protein Plec18167_006959 [Paecilomyces lecythidis]|uniref:Major facilitator superfamily (MFS) profile domain-containing protein n=1 Tax=Paecilomyces lecythidis TaxID=3004212 RepID=A0ABR3X7A0_9EURO
MWRSRNKEGDLEKPRKDASSTPALQKAAAITILCLSQLMTQAGLGQSIAPLHIIGPDIGARNPGQLSWQPAAYSLTVGTFILIAGRFGDVYGHKRMVVIGWLWFSLWSLICGFSAYSGQILYDICRAFQGMGPAILLPNSIAILSNMFPPGPKKNLTFSVFGATAPNGFIVGAVFSSIFAELVWWPWGYWVMAMVCFGLAILAYLIVPLQDSDITKRKEKGQLDPWGSITGVVGLVLVNFAWNQGPVVGWQTSYTYALLIVGIAFLCLFFVIETRVSHPVVPIRALKMDTAFVLACISAGWSCFGIWVYYTWQLSEVLRGFQPLSVTAQFVPCGISGLIAAFTSSYLLGAIDAHYIMMIALTAFLVGTILVATVPVGQIYWAQTFVSMIITPWGMDLSYPSGTIILSNATPREHQGIAASLMNTVVNYSISIGLGIAGTVESQINKSGNEVLRGYRSAWYVGIGLSGLGVCIATLFAVVSEARMRRKQPDNSVSDSERTEVDPAESSA